MAPKNPPIPCKIPKSHSGRGLPDLRSKTLQEVGGRRHPRGDCLPAPTVDCRVAPRGGAKVVIEVVDHGDEKIPILIDQNFKTRPVRVLYFRLSNLTGGRKKGVCWK